MWIIAKADTESCKNFRQGIWPFSLVNCHYNITVSMRYVTQSLGSIRSRCKNFRQLPEGAAICCRNNPSIQLVTSRVAAGGDPLNVVKISGVDRNSGVSGSRICEAMEGNARGLRISEIV